MEEKAICILELKSGEKGEIYRIYKKSVEEIIGLHEGQVVEVIENLGHGPIILKTEDGSKITLGRGQVSSVFVKKLEK